MLYFPVSPVFVTLTLNVGTRIKMFLLVHCHSNIIVKHQCVRFTTQQALSLILEGSGDRNSNEDEPEAADNKDYIFVLSDQII